MAPLFLFPSLPKDTMNLLNVLSTIHSQLEEGAALPDSAREEVLTEASRGLGLSLAQAAVLLSAPAYWNGRIAETAAQVNRAVKKGVVTFYGVVYIHDYCKCHCAYCGDSLHATNAVRTLLTREQFISDVSTLLHQHPLKEICFLMGEDWQRFSCDQLIEYLQAITPFYREKIILNIPPVTVAQFRKIRAALPDNRLHFRVFQETYDRSVYAQWHLVGPKKDFDWRITAQDRALEAGFDESGHGILFGLNEYPRGNLFEVMAVLAHAQALHERHGKWSQSISFPRVLPAPDIDYHPAAPISNEELQRCISVVKLVAPQIDTVITCREDPLSRRLLRPIINIEDYAARPGPGGNSIQDVRQQMVLPDMRSGEAVKQEMIRDGYIVR